MRKLNDVYCFIIRLQNQVKLASFSELRVSRNLKRITKVVCKEESILHYYFNNDFKCKKTEISKGVNGFFAQRICIGAIRN